MNDFQGSIAQQYVRFTTIFALQTNPGAQFGKGMIYVDQATLSGVWSGSYLAPGKDFEVTPQNFSALVTGGLLNKLTGYFAANSIASIIVSCWDATAPSGIQTAYAATKYDAFWKTMYLDGIGLEATRNSYAVKLAVAAFPDVGIFSQVGFGVKDADVLNAASTTSLPYLITQSAGDALVVYQDPTASTTDPWLDQLGITLGALNGTATAVGNATDYIATLTRNASGPAGVNLDPISQAALVQQNVGWWLTLGDGTGQVALRNLKTIKGDVAGAKWVTAYIDYVASIQATEFLTSPATPQGKRRNNSNYQAILSTLAGIAGPFTDKGGIGDLSGFTTAVAPPFSQVGGTGTSLIVPHAWQASYVQGIHDVLVQGTLFIPV